MKSPTNSNPQYYHGIFYPQTIPNNPNTPTYFHILRVSQLMAPQMSLDNWSFNDTSTPQGHACITDYVTNAFFRRVFGKVHV